MLGPCTSNKGHSWGFGSRNYDIMGSYIMADIAFETLEALESQLQIVDDCGIFGVSQHDPALSQLGLHRHFASHVYRLFSIIMFFFHFYSSRKQFQFQCVSYVSAKSLVIILHLFLLRAS